MRKYEVKMQDGSTKYISANSIKQAKDRAYLYGDNAKSVQPIFNKGGKGKSYTI